MRILAIGDVHAGSIYGLCTKEEIRNVYQEWALGKFQEIVNTFSGTIDKLSLIGDIVDGPAPKDPTSLWTTDVQEQAAQAITLLSPLADGAEVHGCSGSGYHYGKGTGFDGDKLVTQMLNGKHSKVGYYIETPFGLIQFFHQSKNPRTMVQRFRIRNGETDGAKMVLSISAHLHRYKEYQEGSVKVIQTPCWQHPTEFMGIGEPVDIGCVLIDIDEYGIHTYPFRYSIPYEIEKGMFGFEQVRMDELEKRREKENEIFSKLSGVSVEKVGVIRNVAKPLIIPTNLPTNEVVKKLKNNHKDDIKIPKI